MKQLPPEYYQLLEQLQAIDFVLVELTLYLDTHPLDNDSINQFNHCAKERKRLKKANRNPSLVHLCNLEIAIQAIHGTGAMNHGHGKYKSGSGLVRGDKHMTSRREGCLSPSCRIGM